MKRVILGSSTCRNNMKKILIFAILLPTCLLSQREDMLWSTLGVKGSINRKIEWSVALTGRFGTYGAETTFGQTSLKFKLTKWLRPSLDYRLISNLDDYGNYRYSNRLNLNAELKYELYRLNFELRLRYQSTFSHVKSKPNYNADFDQAIRIKPQITYNIKGSPISPVISFEGFYDPVYGLYGKQFIKYRLFLGIQTNLKESHSFTIGYLQDQKINVPNPLRKNIFSLNYIYSIHKKSSKKG